MLNNYIIRKLNDYIIPIAKRNKDNNLNIVMGLTNKDGFVDAEVYFRKKVYSDDITNYKVVSRGQFAYNPTRINVGSISYLKQGNPFLVSPLYIVFDTKNIDKEYLLLFLKSLIGIYEINKNSVGASRKTLPINGLSKIKIVLPNSINDQAKCAQLLNKINLIIDKRKVSLNMLDDLRKSIFINMFSNFHNCKSTSLSKLILNNEVISYGLVQPGENVKHGVKIIRPVDIANNTIDKSNLKVVDKNIESKYERTRLNGDEILITIRGTTGKVAMTDKSCKGMNVSRDIAVLKYDRNVVNPKYLYEYLQSKQVQRYIAKKTKGATLKGINLSDIRKLKVFIPSIDQQNKFDLAITKIYNMIENTYNSYYRFKSYRKRSHRKYLLVSLILVKCRIIIF